MAKSDGLGKWFKENWVDIRTGKPCGRRKGEKRGYPKCLPAAKYAKMSPSERKSAIRRKKMAEKMKSESAGGKAFKEYQIRHHSGKCPCCGASVRNPYTYAWIAKNIGMSNPSIDKYFSGVAIPSIKTLALIADLLETSIHELLRGVES